MDFVIPVMPPMMPSHPHNTPITEKENLMRAFSHEKPLWMPVLSECTCWSFPPAHKDASGDPSGKSGGGYDWFGTWYEYSPQQQGYTPMPGVFEEIGEWRDKVKWPDLSKIDWKEGSEIFKRDPDKAFATRCPSGCIERLIAFEGFEQALCDMLLEPKECRAFFDRHGEYRAECIRYLQKNFNFDYIINHDDWANAKSQFFTLENFEETILPASIQVAQAAHESGAKYVAHCCGKMDVFVPYMVDEIHADALEIQPICDIRAILDKYSAKITPQYSADPYILYNPATTVEQVRAYARSIVDRYGAQTCDGAGVVISMCGNIPETYYAFIDEIYNYSGDIYAKL